MKNTFRLMTVAAIALLILIPAAFAQTPEASPLPVTEPLDVGGTILQPGNYLIRVLPSFNDRNKVQVTSTDMKTVYATVLTIPHPLEPGEEVPATKFVFFPSGEGAPRALRTWFAPNPDASQGGHDIVYEESRAKQLARLANEPVIFYRDETAVAELETTPLQRVTPEAAVETYTYTAPVAPVTTETPSAMTSGTTETTQVAESRQMEMPRTASKVPLIALLGLLSIVAAVAIRVVRPQ